MKTIIYGSTHPLHVSLFGGHSALWYYSVLTS